MINFNEFSKNKKNIRQLILSLIIVLTFNIFIYPKKLDLEKNVNMIPFNLLLIVTIYRIINIIKNTKTLE